MQIYAPTTQADEEDMEKFFEQVESTYKKEKKYYKQSWETGILKLEKRDTALGNNVRKFSLRQKN